MYTWAVAAYLAAATADVASGSHARAMGAREVVLPSSLGGQVAVTAAIAGGEVAATRYLWTHGHKRIAVGVLLGSAAGHGLAARHNWSLK